MKEKNDTGNVDMDVSSAVLPDEEIQRQSIMLQQREWALSCFDCVTDVVMIFNHLRQLVYVNDNGLRMLNQESPSKLLGLRFGEIFGCRNAKKSPGGCGRSPFCKECGGLEAILSGVHGTPRIVECRLLLEEGNDALELLCKSSPVVRNREKFTVVAVTDLSDLKRRQFLENVFLNDVKDTAGGLRVISEILKELYTDNETYFSMLEHTTNRLMDEVEYQKVLLEAEQGILNPSYQSCDAETILRSARFTFLHHPAGDNRKIRHEPVDSPIRFQCEPHLLSRAYGNLVVNALEACEPHQQIVLSATQDDHRVYLNVHNPGVMPDEVQHQVFQRSFTTKGNGRGVGAYFAKLIVETYLRGGRHV